ncbi:MAG: single-stranded-DNA-specific exonuclease RecJ [Patescibacteria group bacterium]|nr:single-stranded-DNA-specific exonuclease RecJ [Patescibacteria group bacterium]MDE2116737.1 single-stranded-DNA-specific exonuclease RecJ [Patescibacteria group bacterium]
MRYSLREPIVDKPAEFSAFSDVVSGLLLARGVRTMRDAEAFLAPDYDSHTHDPFLMKDMDRAVERVYRAIKTGEKIVVFSDFDADGIPGAVVLHDAFKRIGFTGFETYIPHRHDEGFGLNMAAIDEFKASGATLVITIDCGIADTAEVDYARSLGLDVIITDHHEPPLSGLPAAYAILNPKVVGDAYPEKMLCGSGVIFKFVQAFFKTHGGEFGIKPGWEKWFLDMVGIATLSDMVPLTGENRALAYYGLKVLKKTPRPGLGRLFEKLRLKREHLSEDDIGFTVTPRINAASRMGEPSTAFDLLSTDDEALAGAYADALERVNNERKGTVAALVKEVKKTLASRDADGSLALKKAIVLGNPSWRPSLLGLVANSLVEEYGRPVFLWGRDGEGIIKGSCRGAGALAIMQKTMQKTPDSFIAFGGHGAAGGFEVANDRIHILADSLEKAAADMNAENASGADETDPTCLADARISLEDVSWDLYKDIEKLSPFGVGNPKPLFIIGGARVAAVKSFGKEGDHTEIIFQDLGGRKVSAVKFFSPSDALPSYVKPQAAIDVVAHLEKSTFKSYPELRLRIVDIL